MIIRGELTAAARREFDPQVTQLLDAAPSAVTVDMRDVTYIDSSWIEVLMQLRTRVGGEGEASIRVSAASASARQMLELSGLAAEVVMPMSAASAQLEGAERASTPPANTTAPSNAGPLSPHAVRETRPVATAAGAALGASSREPPSRSGPSVAAPPQRPPLKARPPRTMKMWFKGRTDLQKLFLAGAAGTLVAAVIVLGPPHGGGLTSWSAPSRAQVECAARYRQRDVTGVARDRDTFMRNCVTADQATLADMVALSTPTSAAPRSSASVLSNRTPDATAIVEDTAAATIAPPTSVAATPPSSPARRKAGQSTSVPAATTSSGDCNCRADNWCSHDHHRHGHDHNHDAHNHDAHNQPSTDHGPEKHAREHGKGHKKGPGRED